MAGINTRRDFPSPLFHNYIIPTEFHSVAGKESAAGTSLNSFKVPATLERPSRETKVGKGVEKKNGGSK